MDKKFYSTYWALFIIIFVSCSGIQVDLHKVSTDLGIDNVGVIREPALDAKAYNNGRIVITEGLLKALKTNDQLAVVLGHELAHKNGIIDEHKADEYSRTLVKSLGYNPNAEQEVFKIMGVKHGRKRGK